MKIQLPACGQKNEHGMVTVIFIALLAIMMILVMTESRALFGLHQEVKRMEQQQIKRLNSTPTNAIVLNAVEKK